MKLIRSELYIAIGDDRIQLPKKQWDAFVEEAIVPRFPKGFSIMPGSGLWHNFSLQRTQRLKLRVIVVLHKSTKADRKKIDAIIADWKKRYPCESVMRVEHPADVAF